MGHSGPDLSQFPDLHGRFLDAVKSPHRCDIQAGQVTAGHHGVNGPQRRFHDPAGGTENGAGTAVLAHGGIILPFRQHRQINACLAQHAAQFPGGEHHIHVPVSGRLHFRSGRLEFLGRTRHDRNGENLLRIDLHPVSVIGFRQSPLHHHR